MFRWLFLPWYFSVFSQFLLYSMNKYFLIIKDYSEKHPRVVLKENKWRISNLTFTTTSHGTSVCLEIATVQISLADELVCQFPLPPQPEYHKSLNKMVQQCPSCFNCQQSPKLVEPSLLQTQNAVTDWYQYYKTVAYIFSHKLTQTFSYELQNIKWFS